MRVAVVQLIKALPALVTLVLTACVPTPPRASPTTWSFIGPTRSAWESLYTQTSGRVRDIAIDPAGTMYIATGGGGVWKHVDGTWLPLTDSAPTMQARSIAIDPSDPRTLYVGTGSPASLPDYHGAGILKSIDGGKTWTHVVGPFLPVPRTGANLRLGQSDGGARIPVIVVSPTDRRVLLASVNFFAGESLTSGIYRSDDGGLNWTQVLVGNIAQSLFFHPMDGDTAYAALASMVSSTVSGVYRSTDSGRTWAPWMGADADTLRTRRWGKASLAMAPSDPRVLYVGMSAADSAIGDLLGFYKSTDGGAHWQRLIGVPDYCAPYCSSWNVVAVHPRDPSAVFVGGVVPPVHRSLDGGLTWEEMRRAFPTPLHIDVWRIAFSNDGDTMYVGTDGGIVKTATFRDALPTWTAMNDNLGITLFLPGFYVDQASPNFIVVGTQDNEAQYWSGSLVWSVATVYEGLNVTYDPVSDRIYRAGRTAVWERGSFRSMVTTGLLDGPREFLPPIVLDPRDGNVQYTATNRIYRTIDAQATWVPVSPILTGDTYSKVSSLALAPSDPEQLCAGTSNGQVWCTREASRGAAATWTRAGSAAGLPNRQIMELAIHPHWPERMGVAFSGYRAALGASGGHVYLTGNRGATWGDVTGNLPDAPVNALTFDARDAGEAIFVATDVGVFRMRDGRPLWARVGRGLPNAVTVGATIHEAKRILYVPTLGRSMWQLAVPMLTAAPGPTIALSPWRLRFTVSASGGLSPAQSIVVRNAGSAVFGRTPLTWTATARTAFGGPWLLVDPPGGIDDATITVRINATGLAPGFYNGVVTIAGVSATNGPEDVLVLLEVTR